MLAPAVRKPACLPEQLLWIRVGFRRAQSSLPTPVHSAPDGRRRRDPPLCSRCASARPRRASVCIGSPECEAQASAISSSPRPKASAAPDSTQRQRLDRLERGAGIDGPVDIAQRQVSSVPVASVMAMAPRWTLSTRDRRGSLPRGWDWPRRAPGLRRMPHSAGCRTRREPCADILRSAWTGFPRR